MRITHGLWDWLVLRVIATRYTGLVVLALVFCLVSVTPRVVYAAPNDVIINELMYNPSSGVDTDEFLELYNTTAAPIDLQGWSFTAGISLTFSSGVTIPANGYIVISPNISQTQSTYGVTPAATYTGQLSNGGETVTLRDNTATVVNSITYDDASPWPTSPDGGGPSLELKDPNTDNTDGTNWGASLDGSTPGAENSFLAVQLPEITNVPDPNDIAPNQAVTITANAQFVDTINLVYKINFGTEQTVPMLDDGASNDGAAGDDIYGAVIPGQAVNTLVRFKVVATNTDGTSTIPSSDDSMNYEGYRIKDTSVDESVPVLEWYMDDADYNAMYANFEIPNQYSAVFVYDNDVFDNAKINIKGSNTRYFTKKGIKVDLPSGHFLNMPGITTQIDKFHLNANFRAANAARVPAVWWVAEESGIATPDAVVTRVQRNGQFEGSYLLIDKYKSGWRQQNGFDNGQLIEDGTSIEAGSTDLTNFNTWKSNLELDRKDPSRREHVLDDSNIPALINFMAFAAMTHHHDYTANQNIFYYRNDATNRWQTLIWDLDLAMMPYAPKSLANSYELYQYQTNNPRFYMNSILDQPELKQAYYRRLATLTQKFYTNDGLLNKYNELTADYAQLSADDEAKWPADGSGLRSSIDEDHRSIGIIKDLFTKYLREPWAVPGAQTDNERQAVQIAEVSPAVADGDEYIRLYNDADTAVDISDWYIEGIDYLIPAGSVIPAKGSVYIVRSDVAYKASHSPVFIIGQYDNDLGGSGGTQILITDQGAEIDSYDY